MLDRLVNRVTMYRLILYYLVGLLIAAIVLSASGVMHLSAINIAISAVILVAANYLINKLLASIFNAPINPESSIITGLILALIIPPDPTGTGLLFLLAASGLAMGSKYLLSYKNKHIFNPAAVAVFLTAFGPHQTASWWVATAPMMPFVLIGGLMLIRKLSRGAMFTTYLAATTVTTAAFSLYLGSHLGTDLKNMLLNSAVLFLGFVMLTEPYSSPDGKSKSFIYAAIVGVVLAPQFHIGHIYSTPEAALLIGNIFAFIVSSKVKLFPVLVKKRLIAKDIAEFVYAPEKPLKYLPGQYMEFTLPHTKTDSRGSRRYFTLASSPTEPDLSVGVRFYKEGSSYKEAMADSERGDTIVAAQLSGDFTLPRDPKRKLVFIAGGIGITPFRSMLKYLIDKHEARNIVLFYAVSSVEYIAYRDVLDKAAAVLNVRIYYVISSKAASGGLKNVINSRLNAHTIAHLVPDLNERMVYVSGPPNLIEDLRGSFEKIGLSHANIKVDFFSGYAWLVVSAKNTN